MNSFKENALLHKGFGFSVFLLTLVVLILLNTPSYGDLGMTKEEAAERFGPPIYISEPNDPLGYWEVYNKNRWLVLLYFDTNGKSHFCSYKLRDMREFDNAAITAILKRNEPITGVLSEIAFDPNLIEAGLSASGLPEQTKTEIRKLPTQSRGWINIVNSYHASFNKEKRTLVIYRYNKEKSPEPSPQKTP